MYKKSWQRLTNICERPVLPFYRTTAEMKKDARVSLEKR